MIRSIHSLRRNLPAHHTANWKISFPHIRRMSYVTSSSKFFEASDEGLKELLVVGQSIKADGSADIDELLKRRPRMQVLHDQAALDAINCRKDQCAWLAFRDGIQIESMFLDYAFLGKDRLAPQETAHQWELSINRKMNQLLHTSSGTCAFGEGGDFQV